MNASESAKFAASRAACGSFAALIALENETLNARFTAVDIVEPLLLRSRLRVPAKDALVEYLHERLRGAEGWALDADDLAEPEKVGRELPARLAEVLNAALCLEDLATHCPAGAEAVKQAEMGHWVGREIPLVCRNRILLETAFGDELRRRPWGQKVWDAVAAQSGEPWVAFAPEDRIGLALSGGGVRSATFNLGFMQALAERGLLGRVDYLATVSGGGYVGGFWTRWRRARRSAPAGPRSARHGFPQCEGPAVEGTGLHGPREIREPGEIRHLREFSRFLMPRGGLNTEFWSAVATMLSGLVPSLLVAASTFVGAMAAWMLLCVALLGGSAGKWESGAGLAAAVGAVLCVGMRRELWLDVAERTGGAVRWYAAMYGLGILMTLGVTVAAMALLPEAVALQFGTGAQGAAWTVLRPSAAMLAAVCLMAFVQFSLGRHWWSQTGGDAGRRPMLASAWNRAMGGLLAVLAGWSLLAGIWLLAGWLMDKGPEIGAGGLGAGTAGLAGAFYLLSDWLKKPREDNLEADIKRGLFACLRRVGRVKSVAAVALANGIVLLGLLVAAVWLRGLAAEAPSRTLGLCLLGTCVLLLAVLWVFDPAALGLHEFYRGRVARCFLGAGRVGVPATEPADDRVVVERVADDMPLREDSGLPIHLVCCAGNQTTAEDQLATLHRGARSATLSRFGIAWGDHWAAADGLRLSSALTASAAAFNSLMGARTMVLGRAVPFVMTALNLRLGLWVRNPAQPPPALRLSELIPGLQFLRELFGWARCSDAGTHIHLSDGGHFENLALYELIRRHCRYIIVVDAGEDRGFTFDDFGRATRRVREDFGVELEIDLSRLRPGETGLSGQHIAVGAIHYDGVVGTDKGTIVYFKPSLTGDEPPDVQQYQRGNPAFPHQTTGDQFFDEAQFESYRRLGEHVANAGFGPLERQEPDAAALADETIFWRLRQAWHRVPWMDNEAGVRLCDRAQSLDADLAGPQGSAGAGYLGLAKADIGDEEVSDAFVAIRACKLMEEAWVTCVLEQYWSHILADNWMSSLHRWAALPAVRRWWPAIKPLYGDDFQAFAERQLHLPRLPSIQWPGTQGAAVAPGAAVGLAERRYRDIRPEAELPPKGTTAYELVLSLPRVADAGAIHLQIGLVFVVEDDFRVRWTLEDLFVVPEFAYGDYLGRALDGLVAHYRRCGIRRLEVELGGRGHCSGIVRQRFLRNQASRRQQTDLIDFYRSRGFGYDQDRWRHGRCVGLVLEFPPRHGASPAEIRSSAEDCALSVQKYRRGGGT